MLAPWLQRLSGKNKQPTQTPQRGAQCSYIGCIGLRPVMHRDAERKKRIDPLTVACLHRALGTKIVDVWPQEIL